MTWVMILGAVWAFGQCMESREQASYDKALEPRYTRAQVEAMTCEDYLSDSRGGHSDAVEVVSGAYSGGNPWRGGEIMALISRACHGDDLYVSGALVFHPTTGRLVPIIEGATQAYNYEYARQHPPQTTRPVLRP